MAKKEKNKEFNLDDLFKIFKDVAPQVGNDIKEGFKSLGKDLNDLMNTKNDFFNSQDKQPVHKNSEKTLNNEKVLYEDIKSGNLKSLIKHLKAGYDPNTIIKEEKVSPLHLAIKEGRIDMVDKLLKYNADPNFQVEKMMTPLHYAVSQAVSIENAKAVHDNVELLLTYGARPDLENTEGATPYMLHQELNKGSKFKDDTFIKTYLQDIALNKNKFTAEYLHDLSNDHPVKDKALNDINVVELRLALNFQEKSEAYKILKDAHVDYETFSEWAEMNEYSDKAESMAKFFAHDDL